MNKTYKKENKFKGQPPAFGKDMRDEEFPFIAGRTLLNHGSYGGVPKKVMQARSRVLDVIEEDVVTWIRTTKKVYWDENLEAVAAFLGSDVRNVTFVENTTTGLNAVFKSIQFQEGDVILRNSYTYSSMKSIIEFILEREPGVTQHIIEHTFPILSKDQIIEQYRQALENNPNIKVTVIDHISSKPAIRFPIEDLIPLCHAFNVMVVIDGAHAPGEMTLNLDSLGADFYIGNLHKWSYAARGSAVMWVDPKFHDQIHNVVTSANYKQAFPGEFTLSGTRDDSPYCCSKDAIEFYEWIGGIATVTAYTLQLLDSAQEKARQAWGGEVMPIPEEMRPPTMHTVSLPELPNYPVGQAGSDGQLSNTLSSRFNIICVIATFQGKRYTRFSANVYCTDEDYQKFVDAIVELRDEEPGATLPDISGLYLIGEP